MKDFVSCLLENNLLEAKEILVGRIEELISEKLESLEVEIVSEVDLDEGNIQRMGRTKLIRVRIRKGKIQRRVKKAAVKGYTVRSGKLVRMTPMEKRHRKIGARRAKFKRRSKMTQMMRKRNISIRKRKGLGLQ